jgi:hypothetical protein
LRKFLHGFDLRLALLATVALLMGQVGATAHAYAHGAAVGATYQNGLASHDPCNDCLAYAPLLSAAASPGALPGLEPQVGAFDLAAPASSLIESAPKLGFRSRAPPIRP